MNHDVIEGPVGGEAGRIYRALARRGAPVRSVRVEENYGVRSVERIDGSRVGPVAEATEERATVRLAGPGSCPACGRANEQTYPLPPLGGGSPPGLPDWAVVGVDESVDGATLTLARKPWL